jgi:hypothetical protein
MLITIRRSKTDQEGLGRRVAIPPRGDCLPSLCAAKMARRCRYQRGHHLPDTRSGVVLVARSFLDAGTEVLPRERKFLDWVFADPGCARRRH